MPQLFQVPPSGAATAESVDSDLIDPDPASVLSAIPIEPIEPASFSGFPLPTGKEEFAYWRSRWTMSTAGEPLAYWRGFWGKEAPASESPSAAQPMATSHPMAKPSEGEPIVVPRAAVEEYTEEEVEPVARKLHRSARRLALQLVKEFLIFEPAEWRKIFRGTAVLVRMRNGEKVDCECGSPDGCVLTAESGKLFSQMPPDARSALWTLDILAKLLRYGDEALIDITNARKYVQVIDRTKVRWASLKLVDPN